MKIAVVGIGVAGAYLMNMLGKNHDIHVVGFERLAESQHDAVCAWATCKNVMAKIVKECGLEFENYILHDGKRMDLDLGDTTHIAIGLKGMVSYDKLKLIQDMINGTDIEFGKVPSKQTLESDFDLIVDSTGFHRNYLPRLENELWIPCVQYKVRYDQGRIPFDDFYLKAFPSMMGYFWYFPLGGGYAHIGAGDFSKNQNRIVDDFINSYPCEVIKKVGRPVRITPPAKCLPFTDGRKCFGVGESIGTVFALLGEGIIPATWCAQLFIENLYDLDSYNDAVLKKFEVYSLVYKFVRLKMQGKFNLLRHSRDLLRIYNHMKSEEDRYGMEVKIGNMMKVSKI